MSTLKTNRIENLTTTDGGINIDNSGRVGIDTTSPTEKLTVTGGNIQVDASSRKIGFKLSGNSNAGYFIPYNSDGNTELINERSGGSLIFKAANTEQMRVTSSGLTFGGDTAASNALDDYEEGTWTPSISNTGYTYTYSTQEGQYTKIGRLVTLRFRLVITARSGSASGGHGIINLPLTSDGTMDGGIFHHAMPTELILHKVGTTTSNGAKTLLSGGLAHSNTSNFWVNNPTVSTSAPFDLGSDFHLGGVITYTSNA